MTEKKRPKGLERQIEDLKSEAHNNVVDRGTVQFRLDAENMNRLLKEADRRGLGYGVLARQWTLEKLATEQQSEQLLEDRLSSMEAALKNLEAQNKTLLQYLKKRTYPQESIPLAVKEERQRKDRAKGK